MAVKRKRTPPILVIRQRTRGNKAFKLNPGETIGLNIGLQVIVVTNNGMDPVYLKSS